MKYFAYLFALIMAVYTFAHADVAYAGTIQMRVKNLTHTSYSTASDYASSARTEPGDTLSFRMFFLGDAAASEFTVDFPVDLTFVSGSTSISSGNAATVTEVDADTIKWTFAPSAAQVMTFRAMVKSGASLSTTHTQTISFSTNGTPATSDNATVKIGPIVTDVTPSSNTNDSAQLITITGHGLTGATAVSLSDGTSLSMTGATITDTSISGASLKVPALHTVGSYYVLVSTVVDGTTLTTEASDSESRKYTVTDGVVPQMQTGLNAYSHSTGVLTLNFDETMDASLTNLANIYVADASTGGNATVLTGATVTDTDGTSLKVTLDDSLKNTISGWGKTASTLYVRIAASGVFDLAGNQLSSQASRTALDTWTKDAAKPTVSSFTVTQNSTTVTSAKAGAATLTIVMSEPVSVAPLVTITQQGTASTTNAAMTAGSNNVYTYDYTVSADDGSDYIDGQATVAITTAEDYAGNALDTAAYTFTIDTVAPSSTVSSPTSSGTTGSSVTLSWTPSYSGSDFGSYKIYYATAPGVTSSTPGATEINSSDNASLGTSSTGSFTVSNLSGNQQYYFVVYVCDIANNCSSASDEVTATTTEAAAVIVPPSSGGGGSGYSAPTTSSTSKTVSSTGGTVTTTTSSGASATVTIPAGSLTASTSLIVSESTSAERSAKTIPSDVGSIIGTNMFGVTASQGGTNLQTFESHVTVSLTYTDAQILSTDKTTLRIARYNSDTSTWEVLASTLSAANKLVQASTVRVGTFALIRATADAITNETTTNTSSVTPSDEGAVAGTTVGAYPDGTLLKSPDSSAVWYIENGIKRLITSAKVFETRFHWKDIITLPSSLQLDVYATGSSLAFGSGTLVKEEGSPAVYRVSFDGALQPIVSAEVFEARGYSFDDILEVEPGFLDEYDRIEPVSAADGFYTGDLIKIAGSSSVYYVDGSTLRVFPSSSIFSENGFSFKQVRTVQQSFTSEYAIGNPMVYPDGTLIKGDSPAVYVVSNGMRRPIVSAADFEALLYQWEDVLYAPDEVVSLLAIGSPIQLTDASSSAQ